MEVCVICKGPLPPLNGVEENDFKNICEECEVEQWVKDIAFEDPE